MNFLVELDNDFLDALHVTLSRCDRKDLQRLGLLVSEWLPDFLRKLTVVCEEAFWNKEGIFSVCIFNILRECKCNNIALQCSNCLVNILTASQSSLLSLVENYLVNIVNSDVDCCRHRTHSTPKVNVHCNFSRLLCYVQYELATVVYVATLECDGTCNNYSIVTCTLYIVHIVVCQSNVHKVTANIAVLVEFKNFLACCIQDVTVWCLALCKVNWLNLLVEPELDTWEEICNVLVAAYIFCRHNGSRVNSPSKYILTNKTLETAEVKCIFTSLCDWSLCIVCQWVNCHISTVHWDKEESVTSLVCNDKLIRTCSISEWESDLVKAKNCTSSRSNWLNWELCYNSIAVCKRSCLLNICLTVYGVETCRDCKYIVTLDEVGILILIDCLDLCKLEWNPIVVTLVCKLYCRVISCLANGQCSWQALSNCYLCSIVDCDSNLTRHHIFLCKQRLPRSPILRNLQLRSWVCEWAWNECFVCCTVDSEYTCRNIDCVTALSVLLSWECDVHKLITVLFCNCEFCNVLVLTWCQSNICLTGKSYLCCTLDTDLQWQEVLNSCECLTIEEALVDSRDDCNRLTCNGKLVLTALVLFGTVNVGEYTCVYNYLVCTRNSNRSWSIRSSKPACTAHNLVKDRNFVTLSIYDITPYCNTLCLLDILREVELDTSQLIHILWAQCTLSWVTGVLALYKCLKLRNNRLSLWYKNCRTVISAAGPVCQIAITKVQARSINACLCYIETILSKRTLFYKPFCSVFGRNFVCINKYRECIGTGVSVVAWISWSKNLLNTCCIVYKHETILHVTNKSPKRVILFAFSNCFYQLNALLTIEILEIMRVSCFDWYIVPLFDSINWCSSFEWQLNNTLDFLCNITLDYAGWSLCIIAERNICWLGICITYKSCYRSATDYFAVECVCIINVCFNSTSLHLSHTKFRDKEEYLTTLCLVCCCFCYAITDVTVRNILVTKSLRCVNCWVCCWQTWQCRNLSVFTVSHIATLNYNCCWRVYFTVCVTCCKCECKQRNRVTLTHINTQVVIKTINRIVTTVVWVKDCARVIVEKHMPTFEIIAPCCYFTWCVAVKHCISIWSNIDYFRTLCKRCGYHSNHQRQEKCKFSHRLKN